MKCRQITVWITIITMSALLAACAPAPTRQQALPYLSPTANQYLQQAQTQVAPLANDSILNATNSMIETGDFNGARQEMALLAQQKLNPNQSMHLQMLKAYLLLETGQPYEAIVALSKVKNKSTLPAELQTQYRHILSTAYTRNNQINKSIVMQLIQMENQKPQASYVELWYQLQNLPLLTLNQLEVRYRSNIFLNGWLRLAVIAKENSNHWQHLADSLIAWKQQFPNHPGNQFLPAQTSLNNLENTKAPSQIAVLLPSTGPLAGIAKAIEDGIISSYFKAPQKGRIALRFYDTSTGDVSDIYEKAIDNGAQVVIGPLTKNNVENIAGDTKVPTIALNYSNNSSNNLIQFGLSPTQEAKQAALHAWQYGVNRVLTITPNSTWGNMLFTAFSKNWQYPNSQIVDSLAFKPDNIKLQVATILGVAQSYQRADVVKAAVKYAKNQYTRFTPRRRQDFNGIFIACTPSEAKIIIPLLKFYFAGNLPIFSTSSIYRTNASQRYNQDFNNTYFCDMPFIIDQTPTIINLRDHLKNTWENAYRYHARLIALGFDSYHLAQSYRRINALPYFGIQGVTGRLYLKANRQIYRQLSWAQFKNGKPVIVK